MAQWFNPSPSRKSAVAQALRQQAQEPLNGQMVSGHYVAPSWAQGLSKLASGYFAGKVEDIEQQDQDQRTNALTRALIGDASTGPQQPLPQRLAGMSDNPMAQQMAQQLSMKQAEQDMQRGPQIIKGSDIGANPNSVYQLAGNEYKLLSEPKEVDYNKRIIIGENGPMINPLYMQAESQIAKAGASNIDVRMGGGDQSKFFESLQKSQGDIYSDIFEGGVQAQKNLAQIQRLEGLLEKSGSGFLPAAKVFLSQTFGVDMGEDADAGTAAKAIAEKMVMEGRPPGSGVFTDADAERIIQTLPRLINQPGGNKLIIQTFRNIAHYDKARAELVNKVSAGEMSKADADRAMLNLEDPMRMYDAARNLPEGVTVEMFLNMDDEDRKPFL
jgi:hypothetical protein